MRQQPQPTFIAARFYFVVGLIVLVILGLILRLADLAIFKQHFLQRQGNARAVRVMDIPAFRGMITDRHGSPFAISTTVYSVWVNPQEFSLNNQNVQALSRILTMKAQEVRKVILETEKQDKEFVYLKRNLAPDLAAEVKQLKLTGVYIQKGYKRFYPEAEIAAHVIGFTNVDDQGQEGFELAYNAALAGMPGKKIVLKDRLGRIISDIKIVQQQKSGNDLVLSIDKHIQYLAYRELMAGVQKYNAEAGSAIVLNAKTGEILAMVNMPSFNPNNPTLNSREALRNRAATDVFEPGSTIKAFSVALALNSGLFKPDTIVDTTPGWLRVGHNLVRDEHAKGPMTVAQVLQVSSNVGVTKMILSLPPQQLWDVLHRAGFGEMTGVGFPGERSGSLVNRAPWKPFALATLSWGYGISATPLQLAEAYTVFANSGYRIPLSFFPVDKPPPGIPVLKPKVAEQMLSLLESVVTTKGATGESAKVPGYRVAGKTGTAKLSNGKQGYLEHYHISTFVGMAPVSDPRVIVVVIIQHPQKVYYASQVSAPVFAKIMAGALRVLDVPPDDWVVSSAEQTKK